MRSHGAQTSSPCLSEQGNTVSNVSRKARALRRRGQVQRCRSEFSGSGGGQGAEECASHRRSLHERSCTRYPCASCGSFARFLTCEGNPLPSTRSRCSSSRFINDVNTCVRQVQSRFPRTVVVQSLESCAGNQTSLLVAPQLSQALPKSDRRRGDRDVPRTRVAYAHPPYPNVWNQVRLAQWVGWPR